MCIKDIFRLCFGLCLIVSMLSSCGSSKKISFEATPEENIIHENMRQDDVPALIQNYLDYSFYRPKLADYLINAVDYEKRTYEELKRYYELSLGSEVLKEVFNDLVANRERTILCYLSEMSVPEIAAYYKSHEQERRFIKDALKNTLLSDLEKYEYHDLHCLYYAFQGTDLFQWIEPIYQLQKKGMYDVLQKHLDRFGESERKNVAQFSQSCYEELCDSVSVFIPTLMEKLLEEDLPKEEKAIYDRYYQIINGTEFQGQLASVVNKHMHECASAINEGRKVFIDELIPDVGNLTGYEVDIKQTYAAGFCPPCPMKPLKDISELQNKTDYVGWGLTAASVVTAFLSMGISSAVIDVIDVGRSLYNAQEVANVLKPYVSQFATQFEQGCQSTLKEINNKFFVDLSDRIKQSNHKFNVLVHEKY